MNKPGSVACSGVEYSVMSACILTFYPGGECYTGCRNFFDREILTVQIEVTAGCEFGSSCVLTSRLCCNVAGDDAVMAVAGLVRDNITNTVKGIVYDQSRIVDLNIIILLHPIPSLTGGIQKKLKIITNYALATHQNIRCLQNMNF